MSPITLAHLGQSVSESKVSGMAVSGMVELARGRAWTMPHESGLTPQRLLKSLRGVLSKRVFMPAFHSMFGWALILSTMA